MRVGRKQLNISCLQLREGTRQITLSKICISRDISTKSQGR